MEYEACLSTKIKAESLGSGTGIKVLEADDYTKDEVQAIRKKGYKVLAYLSVGTIEKERPWFKEYEKCKLKRLVDWPNEFYVDVRKTAWRRFLVDRASKLKSKGFDGWWLDNIDIYSEYKSTAMFNAVLSVLKSIKALSGYVMINGGSEWLDDALDKGLKVSGFLNGYTQEEVFSRILDYDGKGKFGKQTKEDGAYYREMIKRAIKNKVGGFLLEYTRDDSLKNTIKKWCADNKASYYISTDVGL